MGTCRFPSSPPNETLRDGVDLATHRRLTRKFRRQMICVVLLVLGVWALVSWVEDPVPETDIVPEAAVVLVDTPTSNGSAVGVGYWEDCTIFLTADHVISDIEAVNISIIIEGESIQVIRYDLHPTEDLALLMVHGHFQIVEMDSIPVKFGDDLSACGFLDGTPMITGGRASGGDGWSSCDVCYGMSGGGIFRDGKLIGIIEGMHSIEISNPRHPIRIPVFFCSKFTPIAPSWSWIQDMLP